MPVVLGLYWLEVKLFLDECNSESLVYPKAIQPANMHGRSFSNLDSRDHKKMTIREHIQCQFYDASTQRLICLPTTIAQCSSSARHAGGCKEYTQSDIQTVGTPWTEEEHKRFLLGLELFPSGPWKSIANCVGTRTPRQTMSHAQKYRQKVNRHKRGLLTSRGLPRMSKNEDDANAASVGKTKKKATKKIKKKYSVMALKQEPASPMGVHVLMDEMDKIELQCHMSWLKDPLPMDLYCLDSHVDSLETLFNDSELLKITEEVLMDVFWQPSAIV